MDAKGLVNLRKIEIDQNIDRVRIFNPGVQKDFLIVGGSDW